MGSKSFYEVRKTLNSHGQNFTQTENEYVGIPSGN